MANYYQMRSQAAQDLTLWLNDSKRTSWNSFQRTMLLKYGFSGKTMLQMLQQINENFYINEMGELSDKRI